MSHDKIAATFDSWAESGRADRMEEGHGVAVGQVLDKLDIRAGETILDLGCGNGWATRLLAKSAPGTQAIGIDVAPQMIARAEELHSYTIRARYEVMPFENLDFADGHFDRAFSMEAIYYAVDLDKALAEVHRVLDSGGRTDFIVDFYAERAATKGWQDHMDVDMRFLSIDEWKAAFEKAGFGGFQTERVVDPAGPGDESDFEPSDWAPDWATKVAMHEAGSLWMRAAKS